MSPSLQRRLVERLNLYIDCELRREYSNQFDLLADSHKQFFHLRRDKYVSFKEDFERKFGVWLAVRVSGYDRKLSKDSSIQIRARVNIRFRDLYSKERTAWEEPIITAYLKNDNWYFDVIFVDV